MSLFLCPRARPLATSAAATVTRATTPPTTILGLSTTTTRWISYGASRSRRLSCQSQSLWQQRRPTAWPPPSQRTSRRTFFNDSRIRDYEQLPADYRDQVGLPFRGSDLSETEAQSIFGAKMRAARANHLLRVLHGRRIAGTLEDPAYAGHTAQFSDDEMDAALAWLRRTAPVEEVRNAGLRAEDELMQMEAEEAAREEKARKKAEGKEDAQAEEKPEEAKYTEDPVYGHSELDQIRADNEAEAAKEAVEEAKRREKAEEEGAVPGTLAKRDEFGVTTERPIANPAIQAYYNAAQSNLKEPPKKGTMARVLPSMAGVALVLGLMAAASMVYEEPAERFRLLPQVSTAYATVGTIVAFNALVYLAWKAPPLWKYMNKFFIVSVATPRTLSIFLTIFSHQSIKHLATNMIPLIFIGPALHNELGRADFLTLFLACGSIGFLGSLATYAARGMLGTTTLGSSGATLGLCAAYFWEHRMDGFRIMGLPPDGVHGVIFLALLAAVQLRLLGKTLSKRVDVASHVAGMAAGVAGVEALQRTAMARQGRENGEGRSVIEVWFWMKPWLHARAEKYREQAEAAARRGEEGNAEGKSEKSK